MINFFRRIRKKLLEQNRLSKYLVYAAGEIILVMIGILLALQVNNWNENRKTQKNETITLTQLNADLKKNLKEVVEIKIIQKQCVNGAKSLLHFLTSKKSNADSLSAWLTLINDNPIFNNANTAYKNIENISSKIISNDSLRLRITWMYERELRNIHWRENYDYSHKYAEFNKQQRANFTLSTTLSEDGKETLFKYHKPKNIEHLKANDDFKNALIDLYDMRKNRFRFLSLTEDRLKLLIEDIDKEIDRKLL